MNSYRYFVEVTFLASDDTLAKEKAGIILAGLKQRLGVSDATLKETTLQEIKEGAIGRSVA